MNIFDFDNYKDFVRARVRAMPRRGHGQYLRIAKLLDVHTTMVSHIFKDEANLSVEQALVMAGYLALKELETRYFVVLVQMKRATNAQSRAYFRAQIDELKNRALNLSERLEVKKTLDEKDQALFYSAWYYSGIRLLIATEEFRSAEAVADRTGLPLPRVARVLDFLLATGLIIQEKGRFAVGETRTYVDRDSPFVSRHHLNWRLRAIEQIDDVDNDELVFTNPITISRQDFPKIREEIVRFLETFKKIADPSAPEQVCLLNVDWRRLR